MQNERELAIAQNQARVTQLWDEFIPYARRIEQASNTYVSSIGRSGEQAYEQTKGLLNWVIRAKGSYDSKLWEMEVLLNHLSGNENAVAYFGYDTKVHPDVAIVNRKANTAVAIEIKQVESQEASQVHVNLYKAMDQLWSRYTFDEHTPYTRWKAYIYINAGNPWPWTKPSDDPKTFDQLIAEKAVEQQKTAHWAKWTNLAGEHKIEVSIWHADHGRRDYVLAP